MQIADELREQIETGRLRPGDRLPSTRDLAESYGVAQMTIHSALRMLKAQGRIESWQGRGTFVTEKPPPEPGLETEIADLKRLVQDLAKRVEDLERRADE